MNEKAILSVTSIHGGGPALNVIPESVEFGGTIRCRTVKSREYLFRRIEEVISGTVAAMQASYELKYEKGCPPLINDEFLTRISVGAAEKVVGNERVAELRTQIMAADDMAVYLQQVPGTYLHLGCGKHGYENYPLHNPHFELDEDILCTGSALLAQTALDALHAIKYETSI
jgi:amidohydrolase